MDIIRQNLNDDDSYGFIIGGMATDGVYRIAQTSSQERPEEWLAANPVEAQALIDAGEYDEEVASRKVDFEPLLDKVANELSYLDETIDNIDTMTAVQVRDVVKRLAQENRETLKAWRYVLRRL